MTSRFTQFWSSSGLPLARIHRDSRRSIALPNGPPLEAFRPKYEAAVARREAEVARATGLAPHHTFRTSAEEDRHLAAMRVVDEEMGFQRINDQMEALASKLDPLVQAIISAPAQNLEDLALKANAAATVLQN